MTKKQYIRTVSRSLCCGSKLKKELLHSLEERIQEKIQQGMTIQQIVEIMGSPTETAEELNAYLTEKRLLIDSKIIKLYRLLNIASIITMLIFILKLTYLFLEQNRILHFIKEHQTADSFFVAFSNTADVQIFVLVSLACIFLALILVRFFIKKKYLC